MLQGGDGNDLLIGKDGLNNISGGDGDDVLIGGRDADTLSGGNGNDFLIGGFGDDYLIGGAGADQIHGGDGVDTVSYEGSPEGVSVNLFDGTASGGDAEGDILIGIENVIGSEHGDTLRGDGGVNRLEGRGGADFFYVESDGSAANGDTFDGGEGFDTVNLAGMDNLGEIDFQTGTHFNFRVSLAQGYAEGNGLWVNLSSIENVVGSAYADQIFGDDGQNHLSGGAGNDVLSGGKGDDVIIGGGDWDPNDTELDTVCFAGAWSEYSISMNYGLDGLLAYITVADKVAGRDGTDTVYSCEMFQFSDVLLTYDKVQNKAPTDIVLEGNWNLMEDENGKPATASVAGSLLAIDPNNFGLPSPPIDQITLSLSQNSLAWYDLIDGQIVKRQSWSLDYESWQLKVLRPVWQAVASQTMSLTKWMEDIKDGVSSVDHALAVAMLPSQYKLEVIATDSAGATFSKTLIVSVGNLTGHIEGTDGNDILVGTGEEDIIHGLDGDDIIEGGAGQDQVHGGLGRDTLSYASSNAGVTVNLATGATSGGHALGDTFTSIENLIGSAYGDVLTGDEGDNVLQGGGLNDTIRGGGGIDTAVFSGNWKDYVITWNINYYRIEHRNGGADGVDFVYDVEQFQFADMTLASDKIQNKAPTDIVLEGNWNLMEDEYGKPATESVAGSLVAIDPNNLGVASSIDQITLALSQETLAWYGLVDGQVVKRQSWSLDYESWLSKMREVHASAVGAAKAFDDWLEDIKDGVSTVNHAGVIALLPAQYRLQVTATDSAGASFSKTLIMSVGNYAGYIEGTNGNDTLTGTGEDDLILGLDGDDVIEGGAGPDQMHGGLGRDTLSYASSNAGVIVNLATGAASGGHAQGDTFTMIENLIGSAYVDNLTGDAGDNVIAPGAGIDRSDGGAGIDTLDYSASLKQITFDMLTGEVHEYGDIYAEWAYNFENAIGSKYGDSILGTPGNNSFKGLGGDDRFYGRGGADIFDGGDGSDLVSWNYAGASFVKVDLATGELAGAAADDVLISIEGAEGTAGNDILIGNGEANTFYGLDGDDVLMAGNGSGTGTDYLSGGNGNDRLYGGAGKSTLNGGAGDDYIVPGLGAELIQDSDYVTVDYSSADTGIQIYWNSYNERLEGHSSIAEGDLFYDAWLRYMTLIGTDFDDVINGRPYRQGGYITNSIFGDETIYAGKGNDIVDVSSGNNIVYGGEGNDVISAAQFVDTQFGGPAVDMLYGESGDDTISGGVGADFLYGGSGWDWIDAGTDTDVDYVDFGEDGGGLKFTAKGNASNGYGVNVDLSTMTISENRLGSAPVANLWANDIIVGEVTGVWGTALNDLITGSDKDEKFFSGGGYDTVHAGGGADYIKIDGGGVFWEEAGEDFLEVSTGSATVYGGNDNDLIFGGTGSDNLFGDAGNDVLYAYNPDRGGRTAEATSAINHLTGGAGVDTMYGGQGTDYFHSLDDGDLIYGYGNDIVLFDEASHRIVFDQATGLTGNGTKLSGYYYELHGSGLDDEFTMLAGGKKVYGEGGNDIFRGSGTFYGGADDDQAFGDQIGTSGIVFWGGAGNDILWGGSGRDTFYMDGGDDIYVSSRDHAVNHINNFDAGAGSGDEIVLDQSYLYKNGSQMSFDEFIRTKVGYDSYYEFTAISLGDTTIRLYGADYRALLHPDDFLFV